jgi:16S rRNA (cytidine1402-2'-O)-methyltransferase
VFFEAPHRLAASLEAIADAFGADRRTAVCRELTKTYEEVKRGSLAELADWAQREVRGEITLVVAGAKAEPVSAEPDELAGQVAAREQAGESRKEAIAGVAARAGVPKRLVFDAVVAAKRVPG